MSVTFSIGADLFPLLAGVLAAVTCGLLGNFLVLRRLSLMGDAISHSVLPGLVIAFLVTATRGPVAMFVGAAAAGVATVVLVEVVKKLGRVESGAAMGVVFSVLFALGVLLIERAAVRHVDLDADCVLHGQLEHLAWYGAPASTAGLWDAATIDAVPRQVWVLLIACALAAAFVTALFKELRLAAFDPGLSTALGFNATALHYALMIFVAGATVASFEAVGSILVIAMLVCPAATARLLTDRLRPQILVSVGAAIGAAVLGYAGAVLVPAAFGKEAVNAAGSMTVAAGLLLAVAALASPSHGVVARWIRQRRLARQMHREHLLATLYRLRERDEASASAERIEAVARGAAAPGVVRAERLAGRVRRDAGGDLSLTASGRDAAAEIVARHRLWESYLVDQAGLAPDHVHAPAEQLEHLPMRPPRRAGETDPHGRPIPTTDGASGEHDRADR